jgi:alkylation response protein AidB-like acyl-CoA dehydrogenase
MTTLRSLAATVLGREDDDAVMILDVLERSLRAADSRKVFRDTREQPEAAGRNAVWTLMGQSGLPQACYPQEFGGSGAGLCTGVLMAEAIGRHLGPDGFTACAFYSAAFLAGVAGARLVAAQRLLGDKAPVIAVARQDAEDAAREAVPTRLMRGERGMVLRGVKRRVRGASFATAFLVIAKEGDETVACLVPGRSAGMKIDYTPLADGTSAATLRFDDVVLEQDRVLAHGAACDSALDTADEWTRLAIAAELLGLQSTMLDMTLEYIRTRRQFERRLSEFQVLQHRAVDMFTCREMSRVVLQEALGLFRSDADPHRRALLASRAKARAGDAADIIGRGAIQMHGAMGFSDEHDIGMFVKRARVLSPWLGGVEHHRMRFATLSPAREGAEV